MMTPFFFMGYVYTKPIINKLTIQTLLILLLYFYLIVQSIYLLNSYFGKNSDKFNKRFKGTTIDNKKTEIIFLIIAFIFLLGTFIINYLYNWKGSVLIVLNYILWFLYAFPQTNFKANFLLASLIHFFSGIINFSLGYLTGAVLSWDSLLISIYFSLLFVSGHMHHMVIDYEADKASGMKTLPTVIGFQKTSDLSIIVLLVATVFYILLALNNIVIQQTFIPVLVAFVCHVALYLVAVRSTITDFNQRICYRKNYRIIHALSMTIISVIYLYERIV